MSSNTNTNPPPVNPEKFNKSIREDADEDNIAPAETEIADDGTVLYKCGYNEKMSDHGSGRTVTRSCPMKYKAAWGRLVHIKEFHMKVRYTCPYLPCQKVYTRKLEVRKHFIRKHSEKNYYEHLESYNIEKMNNFKNFF